MNKPALILASASPRRKELLELLDVEFEVIAADIEESAIGFGTMGVQDYALRLAEAKAEKVAELHPEKFVLAADTLVVLNEDSEKKDEKWSVLGKPTDALDAERMLELLQGKAHFVVSAFCLNCQSKNVLCRRCVETEVVFRAISQKEIRAYVQTGEPLDKAGAYGIQGLGAKFVPRISGSYTNVVGLPLAEVYAELVNYGLLDN